MSKILKIVPITLRKANEFVTEHHRHNKRCAGCKFSLAALYKDKTVGVLIAGRPVSRRLDDSLTLEINRVCVLDEAPKGTCSFLYAKARKVWFSMGGKKVITYTIDTESGASLRGADFKKEFVSRPIEKGKGWTTRKNREWQEVQSIPRIRWGSSEK